jgi:cytochrome c oxidase subunit 4
VSTVEHEHDQGHGGEHGALEHAHPGARTYTLIGLVLAIITLAEVFFYTQESVRAFLVPLLLVLSASKFALVVGFYMHLRFDHPLFTGVFGFGLVVAASVITALMFLFGQYPLPHPPA